MEIKTVFQSLGISNDTGLIFPHHQMEAKFKSEHVEIVLVIFFLTA